MKMDKTKVILDNVVKEYDKEIGILKEPFKWVKLDMSSFLPLNAISFHVNMKYFYGMFSDEKLEKYTTSADKYCEKFNTLCDLMNGEDEVNAKYLINHSDIMGFLFAMREIRKLHELLSLNIGSMVSNWSMDYIRFFSYNGKYIVTNDCVPIEWKKFVSSTIMKA